MLKRALFLAALVSAAIAAETSLPVIGFSGSFSGSVAGTGDAGTTFVLEGTDTVAGTAIPVTFTVVENSAELLETVDIPTATFVVLAECSLTSGLAECEEIANIGAATTTTELTASIATIEVHVTLVNGTSASASSTNGTASHSSSSSSGSTSHSSSSSASSTASLLPPSFSPTSPPASTAPAASPPAAPTTTSGSVLSYEVVGKIAVTLVAMHMLIGLLM